MKKIAILFGLLVALSPLQAYNGPDKPNVSDIHLSRNESRDFAVGNGTKLFIQNKYGEIILHTWPEQKVRVDVVVHGYGKTEDLAQRVLDRVTIEYAENYGTVSAITTFDKSRNTFVDFLRSFSEEAQAILSRSKVEIDYDIYLPASLMVEIDSKYGDIYLGDLNGSVQVKLSHGALKSGHLPSSSRFYLNFVNTDLQEVSDAHFEIKGGSLDIQKAGNMYVESSVSEIFVGTLQEMRVTSRNDKIRLGTAQRISGKSYFSRLEVEKLQGGISFDGYYGAIELRDVSPSFDEISLTTTGTDIRIKTGKDANFYTDITAQPQNLMLPTQYNALEAVSVGDKNQYLNRKGNIGGANPKSKLYINAKGGGRIRME